MYNAIVTRLRDVRPHPNADRLQLATAAGCTVIVGLDHKDGDLGLYFPPDGQLSEEYAKANDLIRRKDENGNNIGGFFEENRRVRNIRLRSVQTEGYWAPENTVDFMKTGSYTLEEGAEINKIGTTPLCNKYVTQATIRQRSENNKKTTNKKRELLGLSRHWDTPQLKHHLNSLVPSDCTVIITEKLHGTSGRYGNALVQRESTSEEVSLFTRFWCWLTRKPLPPKEEWQHVSGTRNVIITNDTDERTSYYNTNKFRLDAVKSLEGKLHQGETIYFELVGYTDQEKPIMSPQPTKKLKDKEFHKKYGDKMVYSYGCSPVLCFPFPGLAVPTTQTDLYVYRISRTSPDGHELDMPWSQVKARCVELNLKHVPELSCFSIHNQDMYSTMAKHIEEEVDEYISGPSTIDESHIREGVCVRIEYNNSTKPKIFKAKSWTFGVLEGYLKDEDNYVDMEEAS